MKFLNHSLIVLCLAAVLPACSNETVTDKSLIPAGDPCDVYLTISSALTTKGITDNFSDATDLENKISVLEFYVFNSDGNPDIEVGRVDENTPGNGYKKVESDANKKIHKITMESGVNKKIVAVINMNLGQLSTNTYTSLKGEMAKSVITANDTEGFNALTENRLLGFEMTGEKVFTVAPITDNNTVTINVSRIASRINAPVFMSEKNDFINLTGKDMEEIWGKDYSTINGINNLSYKKTGYAVINGRSKSDAFFIGNDEGDDRKNKIVEISAVNYSIPDWDKWSGTNKDNIHSSFTNTGAYSGNYSGKGKAEDWFLNGDEIDNEHRVYVFENKPDNINYNGSIGYDPAETYAVIVKGEIVVNGDENNSNGLNKTRYWRIDLTYDDDYHIFRNSVYNITVNKITTPGYDTPQEAENGNAFISKKLQTAADVEIVVSGWRINTYDTEM